MTFESRGLSSLSESSTTMPNAGLRWIMSSTQLWHAMKNRSSICFKSLRTT